MLCRSRACECSVGMHNMLIVDMLVCTVVSNVPVLVLGLEMTRELLPSLRSLLASPLQSWAAAPILSPSSSRHRIVLAHCAPPAQPGHAGPRLHHTSLVTHHLHQSTRFWAFIFFQWPCTFQTWYMYMVKNHSLCVE